MNLTTNWPSTATIDTHGLNIFRLVVATNNSSILQSKLEHDNHKIIQHSQSESVHLPNMAELRAAHIVSRRDAHNCQPNGLDHGFE